MAPNADQVYFTVMTNKHKHSCPQGYDMQHWLQAEAQI